MVLCTGPGYKHRSLIHTIIYRSLNMDDPKKRCNDVKCNSWPTGIGDDMWEISGECNKYEVCKDGVVQE